MWNVCPALLNQRKRLNAFKLVTVTLKYLGTDEKTCTARQEFRPNCRENLLELLSFIFLFLHALNLAFFKNKTTQHRNTQMKYILLKKTCSA